MKGQIFGYARVSTRDQNLDMQLDVLQRQNYEKSLEKTNKKGQMSS